MALDGGMNKCERRLSVSLRPPAERLKQEFSLFNERGYLSWLCRERPESNISPVIKSLISPGRRIGPPWERLATSSRAGSAGNEPTRRVAGKMSQL